ncbi:Hypothetical predicted protein [Octopus vulgaris]|uniref:Uncharacterized protein n=1 Tax=Octopus vulgaris TaxID=6645 RepID=A0AA36ARL7_OCTVU|nr:Hypothetical predicted protein [Octopus vulgaris]
MNKVAKFKEEKSICEQENSGKDEILDGEREERQRGKTERESRFASENNNKKLQPSSRYLQKPHSNRHLPTSATTKTIR